MKFDKKYSIIQWAGKRVFKRQTIAVTIKDLDTILRSRYQTGCYHSKFHETVLPIRGIMHRTAKIKDGGIVEKINYQTDINIKKIIVSCFIGELPLILQLLKDSRSFHFGHL